MFKNLIAYQYFLDSTIATTGMTHDALEPDHFEPCGPTQEKSIGWIPPRGEDHGALVEAIGGEYIARLMIETKAVPASELDKRVEAQVKAIEDATGRKPGKKERRELRSDAVMELLPQAFPKQSSHLVWACPSQGLLVIEATTQGQADDAITALVVAVAGLKVSMIQTITSPQALMSNYLFYRDDEVDDYEAAPASPCFAVGRSCELKSSDEEKSTIKVARHDLLTDEIRQHISHGILPVKLALTWEGRVSFVLTDKLALKKIEFPDGVDLGAIGPGGEDAFDADIAIATGELKGLIPDLIDALGGYSVEAA